MYSTLINGKATTLGTSGLLYRSNKLMYDRATNTLWSQLTGKPVIGPLAGSEIKLAILPVELTTWGEWRAAHPDTDVLSLNTGIYSPGFYAPEDDSESFYFEYRSQSETMFPVWARDDRLDAKAEVLGMSLDGVARAYPIALLQKERLINDTVGETDVVIFASAESSSARVYRSEGRVFSVPQSEIGKPGLFEALVDSTGVEWAVSESALVNTADPSQALWRVPANVSFWFGWFAFHSDTEVYGIDNN